MKNNQILMDSENMAIIGSSKKTRGLESNLGFAEEELMDLDERLDEFLNKKKLSHLPKDQQKNISSCEALKRFEEKITKKLEKAQKRVFEYNRDHSGCTDFVCSMFEKYIIYIPNGKYFMHWNGVRWKPDIPNFVFRLVELSMNAIRDSILQSENHPKRTYPLPMHAAT